MEKTGVHKCELCDKQFKSRQSKWMHKQRSHPTGTITTTDIEDRIVLLEKRIKEMQDEIDALRAKQASITNNNFSGNNVVNMSNENVNFNHSLNSPSSPSRSPSPPLRIRHLTVDDMHPFGVETDEFLSVAKFKACGYSIVRLLELSHFNPSHPEHMIHIISPRSNSDAYILDSDRQWVKMDTSKTIWPLLRSIVRRVKAVNPLEAVRYDDDTEFLGGENSITFKAMQGMMSHSKMCIRVLTEMGITLPEELTGTDV